MTEKCVLVHCGEEQINERHPLCMKHLEDWDACVEFSRSLIVDSDARAEAAFVDWVRRVEKEAQVDKEMGR